MNCKLWGLYGRRGYSKGKEASKEALCFSSNSVCPVCRGVWTWLVQGGFMPSYLCDALGWYVFCTRVNVVSLSQLYLGRDLHHTPMAEHSTCFKQLISCNQSLDVFRSNNQCCVKTKSPLNKVVNCSHLNVPTPWIRCSKEVLQATWELCRCFCCSQPVCEKNYKWYLPFN